MASTVVGTLRVLLEANAAKLESEFEKATIKIGAFDKFTANAGRSLQRMVEQFSGQKIVAEASKMAAAVERVGGVSKLTENELKRASHTVEEAAAKFKAMGAEVPPAIAKLAKELKAAEQASKSFGDRMGEVGAKLQSVGGKMQSAGVGLTAAITLPLVGIAKSAIDAGMKFEGAMNLISGVLRPTGQEMEMIRAKAIEMGAATAFSATDAATAMLELGKAGFTTGQALDSVDKVLELAAASGLEMGAAAEMAARTMNAFGLETEDLAHVNDVLAKAVNSSTLEIGDLQTAFKYIGPIAQGFNVSIEEVTSALGAMRDSGIAAETSGRALREGLSRMANPVKAVHEVIGELGISLKQIDPQFNSLSEIVGLLESKGITAAQSLRMFGDAAGPGMFALVQKGKAALDELTKGLQNSDGAAKAMADAMMKGLPGAMERLRGSIETALLSISKAMEPALLPVLGLLEKMANAVTLGVVPAFQALPMPVQATIGGLLALVAAIGPLLIATGSLVKLVGLAAVGLVPFHTALLFISNTVPVLAARIWLLNAAQTASAASATLMAGAFGLVARALGLISIPVAATVGVYQFIQAFKDFEREAHPHMRLWNFIAQAWRSGAKDIDEASEKAMTAMARLKSLTDDLSGANAAADMKTLHDAFYELNNRGQMTADVMKRIGTQAKRLQDSGATLSPELAAIVEHLDRISKKSAAASAGVAQTAEEIEKAGKEAEKAAKEFAKLKDSFSGAAVVQSGLEMKRVLDALGGPAAVATDKLEAMEKAFKNAAEGARTLKNVPLAEEFDRLAKAVNPMAVFQQRWNVKIGEFAIMARRAAGDTDEFTAAILSQALAIKEQTAALNFGILATTQFTAAWAPYKTSLEQTLPKVEDHISKTKRLADGQRAMSEGLRNLAQAFSQLAQIAGGSIGSVLQSIGNLIGAMNLAHTAGQNIKTGMEEIGDASGTAAAKFTLIAANVGAYTAAMAQAINTTNRFQAAMGGFSATSSFASGLGWSGGASAAAGIIGGVIGIAFAMEKARAEKARYRDALAKVKLGFVDTFNEMSRLRAAFPALSREWADLFNVPINESVLERMGEIVAKIGERVVETNDEFSGFAQRMVDAGFRIPRAMQPVIEQMVRLGVLSKENAALFSTLTSGVDWKKMEDAAKKFGINTDALNGQFQQGKSNSSAKEILDAFELLKTGGADVGGVLTGMREEISRVVNEAMRLGTTVPENMKHLIDELARTGQLYTENRIRANEWAESALKGSTDLPAGLQHAIKEFQQLGKLTMSADELMAEYGRNAPESVKKVIEELIRQSELVGGDGGVIDSVEEMERLKFGEPIKTEFEIMTEALEAFIAKLGLVIDGLVGLAGVKLPNLTPDGSAPPPGGNTTNPGGGQPITAMAAGAIVSRPTLALIGERGPEIVAPLSALSRLPDFSYSGPGDAIGRLDEKRSQSGDDIAERIVEGINRHMDRVLATFDETMRIGLRDAIAGVV